MCTTLHCLFFLTTNHRRLSKNLINPPRWELNSRAPKSTPRVTCEHDPGAVEDDVTARLCIERDSLGGAVTSEVDVQAVDVQGRGDLSGGLATVTVQVEKDSLPKGAAYLQHV